MSMGGGGSERVIGTLVIFTRRSLRQRRGDRSYPVFYRPPLFAFGQGEVGVSLWQKMRRLETQNSMLAKHHQAIPIFKKLLNVSHVGLEEHGKFVVPDVAKLKQKNGGWSTAQQEVVKEIAVFRHHNSILLDGDLYNRIVA